MKKVLLVFPLLLCNCAGYYDAIKESNEEIARSNVAIAKTCAQALQDVKGDAGATVAISLTICQNKNNPITPESPGDTAIKTGNAIMKVAIPVAAVEISRSAGGRTEVQGDYTHNHGDGTADASRSESHTEIVPEAVE